MKSFNERSRNSKEFLSRCENETFSTKCYKLLKKVPKGKVTTYREIAHALGTRAYRAVGNAMNKNPHDTSEICCHRVVNSNGDLGGFAWDIEVKISRLKSEGIEVFSGKNGKLKIKDFKEKFKKFS